MNVNNQKFRFHLLGIPHTVSHADYVACAYTQKVVKFARMMTERGHEVIHYGHERSQVVCTEHVSVMDDAVLAQAYGDHDWRRHQFVHNIYDHANVTFNSRAIPEVLSRVQPGDFLLCTWGVGHEAVARALEGRGVIPVEPGVGYSSGGFAPFRAYESHAIRNITEGMRNPQQCQNWVIPNYFDPDDFEYSDRKQPWVLFLGRVSELKGITTCVEATARAGVELRIAGQGRLSDVGLASTPAHVQELGYADTQMRRELMRDASALIIATQYLEPFGGVVVEALLSGTPIITPFHGAFAEIQTAQTGFLCHDLEDYVQAIHSRDQIDPAACRARGLEYSLTSVAPQFEAWFAHIHRRIAHD